MASSRGSKKGGPEGSKGDLGVAAPVSSASVRPKPSRDALVHVSGTPAEEMSRLARVAERFSERKIPPNTARAYASDVRAYIAWCRERGKAPVPVDPGILRAYLFDLADRHYAVASIERAFAAICVVEQRAGRPNPRPLAADALERIREHLGTRQAQKAPLLREDVLEAVGKLPRTRQGVRDRALLTLGFATAMRRSELVGLNVGDLEFVPDGLRVHLRRSKTDQAGEGRVIAVVRGQTKACAVRWARTWLEVSGKARRGAEEPLFSPFARHDKVRLGARLSGDAVARIVQRIAGMLGKDPSTFGGHSLRSGFMTSAAAIGHDMPLLMMQSGHKTERIARRYIQRGREFRFNATKGLL